MGCHNLTYQDNQPVLRVVPRKSAQNEKSSAGVYRYGFNGQEKDDEIKGAGNSYSWEERMYDPRTARWNSVDGRADLYPNYSPYTFTGLNPISNYEVDGDWWAGVTYTYFDFDAGLGLTYGFNVVKQSGVARDEVGKTHFTMSNYIYITNQVNNKNKTAVIGAGISVGGALRQSWGNETFLGELGDHGVTLTLDAGAGPGASITFGESSFGITLGVGASIKITAGPTYIDESISLTDDEADGVNDQLRGGASLWGVTNVSTEANEDGFYEAFVTIGSGDQQTTTTQKVLSKDKKVWMSQSYITEAKAAEEEDEED